MGNLLEMERVQNNECPVCSLDLNLIEYARDTFERCIAASLMPPWTGLSCGYKGAHLPKLRLASLTFWSSRL